MSLAGYNGFSLNAGPSKKPFQGWGYAYDKSVTLRDIWEDNDRTRRATKADSLGATVSFIVNDKSPSLEEQKQTVEKFFSDAGVKILATNTREYQSWGADRRQVEIKLPYGDLEKARNAISKIDAAGGPAVKFTRKPAI